MIEIMRKIKKWIVSVELLELEADYLPQGESLDLDEARVREIIDQIGPELPESIGYKIGAIQGPISDYRAEIRK